MASTAPVARRLSGDARRRQLLETALLILREEGADRLTLGYLAERAGVSKPISYNHFGTRAGLLIALYRWLDETHTTTLRAALGGAHGQFGETADVLAATFMECAADAGGEWQAIGAALAGNDEMKRVHRELMDAYAGLFADALSPFSDVPAEELQRRCVGFVGAGEALAAAMADGRSTEAEAAGSLAAMIRGGVG